MSNSGLPDLPFPPKSGSRREQQQRKKYLTAVNDLAAQRFLAGDIEGSWALAEPFFQFADECPYLAELQAAHLLRRGRREEALASIALAVAGGFEHTEALREDPTYESLRDDPRWVEVFRRWDESGFIGTGYKVELSALEAEGVTPLLRAFGLLLRKTPYGAFGYFDFANSGESGLSPTARPFLVLGDGSEVALEQDGTVVRLDSEGQPPRQLAATLREFLGLLATASTTVHELDSDKQQGAGRARLRALLETVAER